MPYSEVYVGDKDDHFYEYVLEHYISFLIHILGQMCGWII